METDAASRMNCSFLPGCSQRSSQVISEVRSVTEAIVIFTGNTDAANQQHNHSCTVSPGASSRGFLLLCKVSHIIPRRIIWLGTAVSADSVAQVFRIFRVCEGAFGYCQCKATCQEHYEADIGAVMALRAVAFLIKTSWHYPATM